MKNQKKFNIKDPIYHTLYGGILISMIGGILETYTFLLRGGVFCNAQTGNIVLMMNMIFLLQKTLVEFFLQYIIQDFTKY